MIIKTKTIEINSDESILPFNKPNENIKSAIIPGNFQIIDRDQ